LGELVLVGDFVLPPLTGAERRDFQTLHFDFGVPLDPRVERDIAHFTALHIPLGASSAVAATRIVPIAVLLS
jgi:hypothetical protein